MLNVFHSRTWISPPPPPPPLSTAAAPAASQITFSLQNAEIVVTPPVNEVNKALGRLVRSLVESTKVSAGA